MKQVLFIFCIYLSFSLFGQQDILRGMITDTKGQPIKGVLISVPQADLSNIETDQQGFFRIVSSSNKGLGSDETVVLIFHSNDYRIVPDPMERALVYDQMNNVVSVKAPARQRENGIRIQMEGKENSAPIVDTRKSFTPPIPSPIPPTPTFPTPAQTSSSPSALTNYEVQIASLSIDNPKAHAYYQSALNMPVNKRYKDSRIVFTVSANSEQEAKRLQAIINSKKIKGIDRAFLVAVTATGAGVPMWAGTATGTGSIGAEVPSGAGATTAENTSYYRIQLKATDRQMFESEKRVFNAKLALYHTFIVEEITPGEALSYKYFVADVFGDRANAAKLQKQLEKIGVKSFIQAYQMTPLED